MDIPEMHTIFRTLAQKQGMQLVRNILPESIDVCINDAIIEKVRTELLKGTINPSTRTSRYYQYNDREVSVMNPINTFRTLFKNARIALDDNVNADSNVEEYDADNGFYVFNIPSTGEETKAVINPLMFLDVSVEYKGTTRADAKFCRFLPMDLVEETIQDFCNRPSKEYPIVVLNNNSLIFYTNTKTPIKYLNIKYIKHPNIVKYSVNVDEAVNCDLPEFLHYEIVENAVIKFIASNTLNQQVTKQNNQ